MRGKAFGVVRRAAIVLMLLVTALWLALVSVVFGEWIAAATRMWAVDFDLGNAPEGALDQAEALRVKQMWAQRLAQTLLVGPVALALVSLLTRVRWLIWLCFILTGTAAVAAVLVDAR